MTLSLTTQFMLLTLVGFACQWGAWRIKIPAILPLLLCGIALGPLLHIIHPREMFGDLLMPGVSIAVAIVLFEGAMTLKFVELRGLAKPVRRLITIGALITWSIMSTVTWWLTDLSLELSLLFGALVTVTGPTVIVPLLRSVRPIASIARILRWEGIVIDPLGALFAVLAYELVVATGSNEAITHAIWVFGYTIGFGAVSGFLVAHAMGQMLKHHLLPEYLRSFMVLAGVIGLFVLSNNLIEESGLMAVTVCGITLTNLRDVDTGDILNFKENLTILLISGLFLILAAQLDFNQLSQLGMTAILILLAAQFVARPLCVLASVTGSELSWREKALLSWIAPRGIVAASVSALFAERLAGNHVIGGDQMVPLTFMIIIGTVALQSVTARPLAKLLKVAEPDPVGLLVIGANPVARTLAEMLQKNGFTAILVDSNWDNIKAARMVGLATFYGHPVSRYADQSLDLVGIGRMLGLSPHRELNTVSAMRYRLEFGEQNIYTLTDTMGTDDKHSADTRHKGKFLFSDDMTFARLSSLMSQGAELRSTKLSEEFGFEDYLHAPDRSVWPLFAIDATGRLHVFSSDNKLQPQGGWSVIGLVLESPDKQAVTSSAAA
jgi:NhaP-type Na+/H+ or K+/H+ antiporter